MKHLIILSAFILAVLSGATATPAQTKELRGRVVGVADGDTITLLDQTNRQHRIRCQGIDTPEKGQDFAEVAERHMGDLAFGQEARVRYAKRDRYGRIVGTVFVGGRDVCLAQIDGGLAWHYKQFQSEQGVTERQLYAEAEAAARARGVGIWRDPAPQPPWDFRRGGAPEPPAERTTPVEPRRAARQGARAAGRRAARSPSPVGASDDFYTNVEGRQVRRPVRSSSAPAGASAQCRDGSYSFSRHRRGTCSHHGGVARWL